MGDWFGWVCLVGNIACVIAAVVGALLGATWLLPFAVLSSLMALMVGAELRNG